MSKRRRKFALGDVVQFPGRWVVVRAWEDTDRDPPYGVGIVQEGGEERLHWVGVEALEKAEEAE